MPGTKFYNCDLHIHTPKSLCYKDKEVTPEMIIKKAIEQKLDIIAITDHNSNEGLEGIFAAAKGANLFVFPGVEITADGGHVIALFDSNTKSISIIDDLLTSCGITKDKRGKEDAIGNEINQVINTIVEMYGGLAIAAHADGKKGFITSNDQGQSRIKIYKNPNLSVMELCSKDKRQFYLDGKDTNYSRSMPSIQSSDAHSLSEIGSRYTKIKMDTPSIFGLKLAFIDPVLRVKFPETWVETSFPYIKSLKVNQGYLTNQVFEFNCGLNCLLGGAGSGKSTIIEFLRFVFDQISDIEDIRNDCYGKLNDLAGVGSIFEVEFINKNGEELIIERTFDGYENPYILKRKKDKSILENVFINEFFPVFAYSQGEAIIISKNPLAQLDLVDKHLNIQEYKNNIEEGYKTLDSQIDLILKLQTTVEDKAVNKKNISTNKEKIKALTEELQTITSVQKEPVFQTHQLWKTEEDFLKNYKENIPTLRTWINDYFTDPDIPVVNIEDIEETTPNKDFINNIITRNKNINDAINDAKKVTISKLNEIEKEFLKDEQKWKTLFDDHQSEYKKLTLKCDITRIEEINKELDILRKSNNKLLEKKHNIDSSEKQLDLVIRTRSKTIQMIKETQSRIFFIRNQYIKQIKKLIPELNISLVQSRIFENYKSLIQDVMKGSYCKEQIIDEICNKVHPYTLLQIIQKKDIQLFRNELDLGDWNMKVINQFELKRDFIYKLDSLHIEDLLEISFKVDKNVFKPLDKLSTGQKATVIVLLSMLDGISPIIFDQPEDALYTPFIYSSIVKLVRKSKEKRQFIFATHNSNIAVASDLDLGIVLESTSLTTTIDSSGGLDNSITNKLVVLHLEGGEEAINKRLQQYQINFN
jgi:DNA repair ATPase RecN